MGFILITLLLQPVQAWLTSSDPFSMPILDKKLDIDKKAMIKNPIEYEEKQHQWIMETYQQNLKQQIYQLFEKEKEFRITHLQLQTVDDRKDPEFGNLREIQMEIQLKPTNSKDVSKKISIEKIKISSKAKKEIGELKEEEEIFLEKNIKSTLVNFYNMSQDNIYITVQKK